MVIGGYTERSVFVLNSWGRDWGDDGWCSMSWDYIKWDQSRDFWTVEAAPYYSE
jgi:C1A family cysteine protease